MFYPAAQQPSFAVADIVVNQGLVYTPSGTCPLRGSTWDFQDMSTTRRTTPSWAIVLAIVFAVFFLIGLLFLLAKEERTEGGVQIVVQGQGMFHLGYYPVASPAQVAQLRAAVNHARMLAFAR